MTNVLVVRLTWGGASVHVLGELGLGQGCLGQGYGWGHAFRLLDLLALGFDVGLLTKPEAGDAAPFSLSWHLHSRP